MTVAPVQSDITLRSWQLEALDVITGRARAGATVFTVVATMGSGKTYLQGAIASYFLSTKAVDYIINVVPSDVLKQNNSNEIREHFGVDLTTTPGDGDGFITTYQWLARGTNSSNLLKKLAGKKFLVLADEVHHGSSHEEARWGLGLSRLLAAARYSLLLSGTLWRSDELMIPGVRYEQDENDQHIAVPDYSYGLDKATKDKCVTPVIFHEITGQVSYQQIIDDTPTLIEDVLDQYAEEAKTSTSYKHLINPKGGFCKSLLGAADKALKQKIKDYSGVLEAPAGLVVCADRKSAELVAEQLNAITGEYPVVVHSGRPGSKELIKPFAKNQLDKSWIVSVGMISEGVDIPRIKVIAYLTRARTELVFHQITGRAMRVRDVYETAEVYFPSCYELHQYAERFATEQKFQRVAIDPADIEEEEEKPVVEVDSEDKEPSMRKRIETVFVSSKATDFRMMFNGMLIGAWDVAMQSLALIAGGASATPTKA